jgi:hypothetical protein
MAATISSGDYALFQKITDGIPQNRVETDDVQSLKGITNTSLLTGTN